MKSIQGCLTQRAAFPGIGWERLDKGKQGIEGFLPPVGPRGPPDQVVGTRKEEWTSQGYIKDRKKSFRALWVWRRSAGWDATSSPILCSESQRETEACIEACIECCLLQVESVYPWNFHAWMYLSVDSPGLTLKHAGSAWALQRETEGFLKHREVAHECALSLWA